VNLVRYGHFWSCDKDGGHTIRFGIAENPMLYANFLALPSREPELEIYIAGIGNFALFCSCDLELDPMTFIYQLDPYPLKMYPKTENEFYTYVKACKKLFYYIHTDIEIDAIENSTTPLRGW